MVKLIGLRLLNAWLGGLLGVAMALSLEAAAESQAKIRQVDSLEFLGEAKFGGRSLVLDGALLGGLSGLSYDSEADLFYAISDDRSQHAPARFYRIQMDLSGDRLSQDRVRFLRSESIKTAEGKPFTLGSVDPEGISQTNAGTLWISSEGGASQGIVPFVTEFSQVGEPVRSLPVPKRYWPSPDWGVGENLGFESLTLTPSQKYLMTATENALVQDGPEAAFQSSSPARLLRFDLEAQELAAEYLYNTDPVMFSPNPVDAFNSAGLVELLALDDNRALALERSFAAGAVGMSGDNGMNVRLYEVDSSRATDIQARNSLLEAGMEQVVPVEKQLVLDLATLDIPLSNLEGMTFGPRLEDGRRSLLMISDDNFGANQFTQVLLFGVNE